MKSRGALGGVWVQMGLEMAESDGRANVLIPSCMYTSISWHCYAGHVALSFVQSAPTTILYGVGILALLRYIFPFVKLRRIT